MNKLVLAVLVLALTLSSPISAQAFAQDATVTSVETGSSAPAATTLNSPSQSTLVARVQTVLKTEGLYSGNISGFHNTATTRALRRYQRAHNLEVNGRVTAETRTAMGL